MSYEKVNGKENLVIIAGTELRIHKIVTKGRVVFNREPKFIIYGEGTLSANENTMLYRWRRHLEAAAWMHLLT